VTIAFEEIDAQFALQSTDLLAQRRLGRVKGTRGPTEVQMIGNGDEVPEVTNFYW
jgi:hypothetical protein